MQSQTSHDVFHITFSKWKVWSFTVVLWIMSCLFLFPVVILTEGLLTGKTDIESSIIIGLVFFGLIFLFVAGVPFLLLTKLKKPLTTLNSHGFSTWKKSKIQTYPWSPNTVITTVGKGILVIANLNTKQSRMSKLWSGPKDKVIIGHSCIEQNRQHILEAINRLSPYPVEYIGMWRAAMV